jgi:hypothetical protein
LIYVEECWALVVLRRKCLWVSFHILLYTSPRTYPRKPTGGYGKETDNTRWLAKYEVPSSDKRVFWTRIANLNRAAGIKAMQALSNSSHSSSTSQSLNLCVSTSRANLVLSYSLGYHTGIYYQCFISLSMLIYVFSCENLNVVFRLVTCKNF